MKLKAKLISTIAAFAMVLCLTIVGVWAASSATVSVTGTINYTVADVNATITGSISELDGTLSESAPKGDGETYSYSKTFDTSTTDSDNSDTWAIGDDLVFHKGKTIQVKLVIKNNSAQHRITLSLTNSPSTKTNVTDTLKAGVAATEAGVTTDAYNAALKIPASGYAVVTLEMYVASVALDAQYVIGLSVSLAHLAGLGA